MPGNRPVPDWIIVAGVIVIAIVSACYIYFSRSGKAGISVQNNS